MHLLCSFQQYKRIHHSSLGSHVSCPFISQLGPCVTWAKFSQQIIVLFAMTTLLWSPKIYSHTLMLIGVWREHHGDVIKWKHFPRNWPFVRGIHRSPVNSPHKGQWRGALRFSLICVWINDWVNNREAGDLRRYHAHYDVIVMWPSANRDRLATRLIPNTGLGWCVTLCSTVIPHTLTTWWRHQMETFSALLAICAGNSPVSGEFPAQRPVTRGFDVFFDLRLNKRLSKQSWGWWLETLSCSLARQSNESLWQMSPWASMVASDSNQ